MTGVWVYKYDGTVQCQPDVEAEPLETTEKALAALIGKDAILEALHTATPEAVLEQCGRTTGRANAFRITEDGALRLFRGFVGPQGFKLWTWAPPRKSGIAATGIGRGGGDDNPWPWSFAGITAELAANIAASLTAAGRQPTQVSELVGMPCRVYQTGDALPLDWLPGRVNIELSATGHIVSIWFG